MAASIARGGSHDFEVIDVAHPNALSGTVVARIWHSDKGVWTVDTVNGPSWDCRSRGEAIASVRPGCIDPARRDHAQATGKDLNKL